MSGYWVTENNVMIIGVQGKCTPFQITENTADLEVVFTFLAMPVLGVVL